MKKRWDGSVQSSNTPTWNNDGIPRDDHSFYRCMVMKMYLCDDPGNVTKNSQNPEVVYDLLILGGPEAGQTLPNARLGSLLGGNFNYYERTLVPSSKNPTNDALSTHDGDIVGCHFVQGHDAYPIITCMLNGIKTKQGTKKADGPRYIEMFNGLQRGIDNKGDFTLKRFGGKSEQGRFTPGTVEDVTVKISENVVSFITKGGLTATLDGKNDKFTYATKGGVTAVVDGKGNKISIKAGSTEITIDGASGKISLKGDTVDLGTSVSDFVTLFTQLASAFNSHTHMVPQAPAGTLPSQPPMAPLLSSVGSQSVKVQS